jgi:hypothetical protein
LPVWKEKVHMSSGARPTPNLIFQITKVAVYSEVGHKEVATAPEGDVTERFGPTQITLEDTEVKIPLNPGEPYEIRADTPHHFDAKKMYYIGELENGTLLFRAPGPNA